MAYPASYDNLGTVSSGQTITSATQNSIINAVNGIEGAAGLNPMRFLCEGRLTLTSGTPIPTSGVNSASTIYFTPYLGNRIALYDGTSTWKLHALDAELSLALASLTFSSLYDVFCYDNAGTPTLELGPAWTDSSTRATGLVLQDGVYVKSGATTRRYLGTFRAQSDTETADAASKRLLWNHYNRVPRPLRVTDATASWTYTTVVWRPANNSSGNEIGVVVGLPGAMVHLQADATRTNGSSAATGGTSIGINSQSNPGSGVIQGASSNSMGNSGSSYAKYDGYPGQGYTAYTWLECGSGAGTDTWYGTSGHFVSGMTGFVL